MSYLGLPEADMRRTCTLDEVYAELAWTREALTAANQRAEALQAGRDRLFAQRERLHGQLAKVWLRLQSLVEEAEPKLDPVASAISQTREG